jgi:hypothetical protein
MWCLQPAHPVGLNNSELINILIRQAMYALISKTQNPTTPWASIWSIFESDPKRKDLDWQFGDLTPEYAAMHAVGTPAKNKNGEDTVRVTREDAARCFKKETEDRAAIAAALNDAWWPEQ